MSRKNTADMKIWQSIDSKWVKYISTLLLLVLLMHCTIWKAEVAIKMCFAKQFFLLFLVNQEKLFAVLAKCLKNYLDFKLLLLLQFRFSRACIFQNTSFTHPFMVAGLGITQLTRWELVVLLILFTFLECLRLPESSIKLCAWCLWGKISPSTQHFAGPVPGLGPDIYVNIQVASFLW